MNFLSVANPFFKALYGLVLKYKFLVVFVVVLILAASSVVLIQTRNAQVLDAHTVQTDKNTVAAGTSKKNAVQTSQNVPPTSTPSNQAQSSNPTPATSQAAAANHAATGQRTLTISPSSTTVQAGQSFNVTIAANDGAALNYPGISSSSPSGLFFNFAAGPAKKTWSGAVGTSSQLIAGTYTYQVFAQDAKAAYYYGSFTVTIQSAPKLQVTLQQLDYDAETDSMGFMITLNWLYGYQEPVVRWYASQVGAPSALECPIEPVDETHYAMACSNVSGPRPTTGTISLNIFTASNVWNAQASFNLPPKP